MPTRKLRFFLFACLATLLILFLGWLGSYIFHPVLHFNGQRAYKDVIAQVAFGARTPGSVAHAQTITYIQQELEKAGWKAQLQVTDWQGFLIQNIIASRSEIPPLIIIGAHYDSRLLADQDPGPGRTSPVPGANDGASGIAILLELARTLPPDSVPVWLVFFDAEDNGGLDSRHWIMGSQAFVASLKVKPNAAIIVDMVGDADLNLYMERNSDNALTTEIWEQAAALGYGNYFFATPKYDLIDDHIPFLKVGIPAVNIIDFDYPYWHTAADTPDKVSVESLQVVGETLWVWIESQEY
jgi:glutaminyl-peptide cyclotransferase